MTATLELCYETHSTTVDNETGIATGWLPGRLSAHGRKQALALGERRQDVFIVYASDLSRAVETAAIAFADSDVPVVLDARLRECNYGELNGRPAAEVAAEQLRRIDEPFPGGESYRDVVERTQSFLADVATRHNGERVLVIGHAANRWALEHLLDGRSLEELTAAGFDWQEGWTFTVKT